MSDFTAIRDVTLQLRWLLFEGLSETNIGNHHVDPQSISVFSPSDVISGNEHGLMSHVPVPDRAEHGLEERLPHRRPRLRPGRSLLPDDPDVR